MLDRDGYPHGVPCWIDTAQPDPEAAMSFYGGLFGWEFADRMPADAPGRYFVARLHGRDVAAIGSRPDDAPAPPVHQPLAGSDRRNWLKNPLATWAFTVDLFPKAAEVRTLR